MRVTEPEESSRYTVLYQATIQHAVGGAGKLIARLVAHTRASLRELEGQAKDGRERDRLTDSRRLLNRFESSLCERFIEELPTAFSRMASVERALPAPTLHFDQLAQMDASQLQQSVAAARAQQTAQLAAGSALTELNRLICASLGLALVQLEHSPLRAAVYVDAVTTAVTHVPVPPTVRQAWIMTMCGALGQELEVHYSALCAGLRASGDGSAATRAASATELGAGAAVASSGRAQALLTLEQLRRLLAERPRHPDDALSQRYAPQTFVAHGNSGFENSQSVPIGFRATVPAAFEAIKEMKRLDQVVRRIEDRNSIASQAAGSTEQAREKLRLSAHGLEQTLGLEVVTMMIDNITHDQRLLGPIQRLVAELEPALLQLALVDPRFFSHKQHPARRLLHEITHRSIAFESVDSQGFSGFMEPLREAVAPLSAAVIETAEPFDKALGHLVDIWNDRTGRDKRQLSKAVKALQKAEQRNALAQTIVADIRARPDVALVPEPVLEFLCGPWAQVVAHARMSDHSGADDPGHYAGLIEDLVWSAQPHLTRGSIPVLTRLVPKLLTRLREGLATITYPPRSTSEFFEVLMNLHQRGFKPDVDTGVPAAPRAARLSPADLPWLAPLEARASGFIELATDVQPLLAAAPARWLAVGDWVALLAEGSWSRTQLTWASPSVSLLLFTDALGYMQSLSSQSCEQLFAAGQLRVISTDPVEDALDAVAQTALRNSVDIRF